MTTLVCESAVTLNVGPSTAFPQRARSLCHPIDDKLHSGRDAGSARRKWEIPQRIERACAFLLNAQATLTVPLICVRRIEILGADLRSARNIAHLRRETEQLLAETDAGELPKAETLTFLRKRWAEIDQHAPTIPQPLWERIAAGIPAPRAAATNGG